MHGSLKVYPRQQTRLPGGVDLEESCDRVEEQNRDAAVEAASLSYREKTTLSSFFSSYCNTHVSATVQLWGQQHRSQQPRIPGEPALQVLKPFGYLGVEYQHEGCPVSSVQRDRPA